MKTQLLTLAVIAASALSPALAAAQAARAPELPDLKEFHERLGDVAAPAAVPARAVVAAKAAGCPVLNLQGATIGRGVFDSSYEVKLNDAVFGTIKGDGDGYVYKDNYGNIAAKAATEKINGGTRSLVTDCSGAPIGLIEEAVGSDSSDFVLFDATGKIVAQTGWTSSSSISFRTDSGETVAEAKNAHWLLDRVQLSLTPKADPRLVAVASVMNNAAGYRRAAERRRERMADGPHGRADR